MARPTRLRLATGGFQGPSWRIELIDDLLVHIEAGWGYEPRVMAPFQASDAAWADLSSALDALGVWGWQSTALADAVLSSAEWSVSIAWDDRVVDAAGGPLPPDWGGLCEAVRAWAGGRPFG